MWILTLAGLALVLVALADLAVTTLTPRGAGPFTSRVTDRLWSLMLARHRRRPDHGLLAWGGFAVVVTLALMWVTLLWAGWSLVFLGLGPNALVESATNAPADALERIYYAGFTPSRWASATTGRAKTSRWSSPCSAPGTASSR